MRWLKGTILFLIIIMLVCPTPVTLAGFDDDQSVTSQAAIGSRSSRSFTAPPEALQQQISNFVSSVSQQNLKSYLTTLQNFGSRLYRAPGMFNASIWLYNVLAGNGRLVPGYHNFTVVRPTWGMFNLSNVILTLPGLNTSSDRIYYMYAHSDAVQFTDSSQWLTNTPGADDDGSGCASILEAARILSQYRFQDTIKFAFFNAEEIGLVGSAHYAENMSDWGENVWGGIDYDMIGYSSGQLTNDLRLMYNSASSNQGQYMLGVNNRYNIGLTIDAAQVGGGIASDIQSFYNRNFPSVFGIEKDFNPYYHTTNDLVTYINFTLVEKCTKLAVASLAEMARLLYTDVSIPEGNLTVSNSKPLIGENVTVNVNITNTGSLEATDMEVVFSLDGFPFQRKRMTIPPFGLNSTTILLNASMGAHNLTVALDPINEIIETDETNNTAFISLLINDRPAAVLNAKPISIFTSESVEFNGSLSFDKIGGVSEYNFSFGDGPSTGWINNSAISHIYQENGEYIVELIVRDTEGVESSPVNLTISVLNRPPSAIIWSNLTRTYSQTQIQFRSNANDPDGIVYTYWDFADGTDTTAVDPVHAYAKSGIYDVKLEIEDDDGATGDYSLRIIIDNRPPICKINASSITGNITTEFSLSALANDQDGEINEYSWDLGNGITDNRAEFSYKYPRPGRYYVRLKVVDDEGAIARDYLTLTIDDLPPVANAKPLPNETNTFDNLIFDGTESYDLEGPVTYSWNFGDGSGSLLGTAQHSYLTPGTYYTTLTVMDSVGQVAVLELEPIIVLNRPPVAKFKTFGEFFENGTLFFDGTESSDMEGALTYSWTFSDGGTGTDMISNHVFEKAGTYIVTLTVLDTAGSSATISEVIQISQSTLDPNANPDDNKSNDDPGSKPDDKTDEPPKKTNSKDESWSWEMMMLLVFNIILIILLALFIIASFLKRRKQHSQDTEAQSSDPVAEPGLGPPSTSAALTQEPAQKELVPTATAQSSYPQPTLSTSSSQKSAPVATPALPQANTSPYTPGPSATVTPTPAPTPQPQPQLPPARP
jgi:PKD repeat protein